MTSIKRLLAAASAAALLAGAGCGGGSTSASGNISYDGRPVKRGAITFLPADGRGPAAGAEILNGRYQADDLIAGPKVVQIEAFDDIPYARSSEESAQQAEAAMRGGGVSAPAARTATIPANAEGNNATVEVNAGKQVLDFHLKPPTRNH